MVISRKLAGSAHSIHFLFTSWKHAEGAELPLAPDDEQLTAQPPEVAAVSATVLEPLPSGEPPSAEAIEVKEEVDYSDPAGDVLGVEQISQPEATHPSTDTASGGAALSAPAEPSVEETVIEGVGPSAPSSHRGLVGREVAKIPNIRS